MRLPVGADPGKQQAQPRRRQHRRSTPPRAARAPRAVAIEPEPDERSGDRQHDPDTRVRQHRDDERRVQQERAAEPRPPLVPRADRPQPERHRRRGKQRQLVPVSQRDSADAPAARSPDTDPGDRPSRPAPTRTTHRATRTQPPRNDAAARPTEKRTDRGEREVDEPTIRVVPRAARLDRPGDRHPLPDDERGEQRRRTRRPRAAVAGPPDPADGRHQHRRRPRSRRAATGSSRR